MRALILCGGEVYDYASIRVCRGDFIICADAGAKHILPLGVKPDVYLGDFDSCDVLFLYSTLLLNDSYTLK